MRHKPYTPTARAVYPERDVAPLLAAPLATPTFFDLHVKVRPAGKVTGPWPVEVQRVNITREYVNPALWLSPATPATTPEGKAAFSLSARDALDPAAKMSGFSSDRTGGGIKVRDHRSTRNERHALHNNVNHRPRGE